MTPDVRLAADRRFAVEAFWERRRLAGSGA